MSEIPEFVAESVTCFFVYSFNAREIETTGAFKSPVYPLDLSPDNSEERSPEVLRLGIPDSRLGIAPYMTLSDTSVYYEFRQQSVASTSGGVFDATLDQLIRLFPHGASLTLALETGRKGRRQKITPDLVTQLLKLVNHRSDSPRRSSGIQLAIERHARNLDEIRNASVKEFLSKYHLERADVDLTMQGRLRRDDHPLFAGLIDQSPWAVTVLEVDGQLGEVFCTPTPYDGAGGRQRKKEMVAPYRDVLAPILYRSVSVDLPLEPAYGSTFESSNLDARLFVCSSRRSILCICLKKDDDPASYFIPGLLDICEVLRARWHTLVTVNRRLDEAIQNLRYRRTNYDRGHSDITAQEIAEVREWMTASLQDPGAYIFAGDALARIYEEVMEVFRISNLSKLVDRKMDHYNKLYEDHLEIGWSSRER